MSPENSGPSWKRMFLNPRSFWRSNFCPTKDPIVSSYSALVKHNLGPKLSLDKRPNGKCSWWKSGLEVLGNKKRGVEQLHDAGFWVHAIAIGLLLFCLLDLLWTKMAWSNKQAQKNTPRGWMRPQLAWGFPCFHRNILHFFQSLVERGWKKPFMSHNEIYGKELNSAMSIPPCMCWDRAWRHSIFAVWRCGVNVQPKPSQRGWQVTIAVLQQKRNGWKGWKGVECLWNSSKIVQMFVHVCPFPSIIEFLQAGRQCQWLFPCSSMAPVIPSCTWRVLDWKESSWKGLNWSMLL